jgi:hypothetical protein
MGYEGWLWTYGIHWEPRFEEIKEMYSGSDKGFELLKEKDIHFMALGPQELERYQPDVAALKSHFVSVVKYKDYELLKVR